MSDTAHEGQTPQPGMRSHRGRHEPGRMRFWAGFAAGVAATAALAQGLLAGLVIPNLRLGLAEYGATIPGVTRFAIGVAWSWGAPLAITLACLLTGIVAQRDRPRFALFTALAVASVAAFAFTYWASSYPLWQLSSELSAD